MKHKVTQAQRLQFAAFLVAASRYVLIGGMAIGIDLVKFHWVFAAAEIVSWLGLAILEGYALPYISRGMRKFETNNIHYKILFAYRIILLLAIPVVGGPYYVAVSNHQQVKDILPAVLYWVWSLVLAGIVAFIIDAVGIVEEKNEPVQAQVEAVDPFIKVALALKEHGWLTPRQLAEITDLSVETVDQCLSVLAQRFASGE